MSNYENIIPEDIASNNFDFHDAFIEIETDSDAITDGHGIVSQPKWKFFVPENYSGGYGYGATNITPPPHFVGIKSNKSLIIDQFDFTASWDVVSMTVKDYKIESSLDGKTWDTLYTGVIPSTDFYTSKCEFDPTICKYIRFVALSTYDTRGYKWLLGGHIKIYGTLAGSLLYTNPDAYGILKKDDDK